MYTRAYFDSVFTLDQRPRVEVYSSMNALELVSRGIGPALVDPLTAGRYVESGNVTVRPIELPLTYRFALLKPRDRPMSNVGRELVTRLLDIKESFASRALAKLGMQMR